MLNECKMLETCSSLQKQNRRVRKRKVLVNGW